MISGHDFYVVMTAMVPLYVAMLLAYGSVRWWRIFTADQCSGINRFVAVFAVPLLSFHFISRNDIYAMNWKFIAADTLQKAIMLAILGAWARLGGGAHGLDWSITAFSLSTLPNTLVMGVPLLIAMYGEYSGALMVQLIVLQCIVWYTLLLVLFEYRAARALIAEQFPGGAGAGIASVRVDPDVVSLDGQDFIQADAEIGGDGRLHVTVRKSSARRPSNLTGAEIYSLASTPRGSNFNHGDFHSMMGMGRLSNFGNSDTGRLSNFNAGDIYASSSRGPTPRPSNFDEAAAAPAIGNSPRFGAPYPAPNPEIASALPKSGRHHPAKSDAAAKDLHMFVWSSSASPVSDAAAFADQSDPGAKEIRLLVADTNADAKGVGEGGSEEKAEKEVAKEATEVEAAGGKHMPPASVMMRLILIMVWRKLIRNPNTYSSLIGLIWALVSFRWHVQMPKIVDESIKILSNAGLGMAMFSLGLFMALQPRLIACGKSVATFAMGIRFLVGPAVMAAASIIIGLRGTLLHIAIVQAALPQGIVPFVFAKEYNVHPQILSTAVIFGMLIALPITLLYYIVLGV